MNKKQAQNLLNVARALRESPNPDSFDMTWYVQPCGTPACALGHYGSRPDLQDFLTIKKTQFNYPRPYMRARLVFISDNGGVDHDDPRILEHFGITQSEADELFCGHGCGGAQTANFAAEYIEDFVATHTCEE